MQAVLNVAERVTYYYVALCWAAGRSPFYCSQLVLEGYYSDHMWQAMHINLGFSIFRISIDIFIFLDSDIVTEPGFVRRCGARATHGQQGLLCTQRHLALISGTAVEQGTRMIFRALHRSIINLLSLFRYV